MNAVVRARIDEDVKEKAAEVLAGLGLSVSDLLRITLTRVAHDGALPFDLKPNKATAETLARSERGEDLHRPADAEAMFRDLGI